MNRLRIRTKITLWYTLLSVLLLSVTLPVVYFGVAHSLRQTIDSKLRYAVSQAIASVEFEDGELCVSDEDLETEDGVHLVIYSAAEILYGTANSDWLRDVDTPEETRVAHEGKSWYVFGKTFELDEIRITVRAASATSSMDDTMRDLLLLLIAVAPVYMLVSSAGAFMLAGRALRPVSEITRTAKVIGSGNLSGRIENITSNDEVGELAATFNNMLDELEVSFQRERRFTSDASHELRMPITVISACAEDALSCDSGENKNENLQTILGESGRMAKIVSQLLLLSRGYEGRYRFTPDLIGLRDMVESVTDELSGKAAENGIALHNDIDESVALTADQSLLTQLFMNLISNAVKYGKSGGNVWINAVSDDKNVKITVTDDGIGISGEDIGHIFKRFYRADKSRDRTGLGLGLPIVKWIAELHNGTIDVKSSMGGGSVFTVTLPVRAELNNASK